MLGRTETVCKTTVRIYALQLLFFHIIKVCAMPCLLGVYLSPEIKDDDVLFPVCYAINLTLSMTILFLYRFFHMNEAIDNLKKLLARPQYVDIMPMMQLDAYMKMIKLVLYGKRRRHTELFLYLAQWLSR